MYILCIIHIHTLIIYEYLWSTSKLGPGKLGPGKLGPLLR